MKRAGLVLAATIAAAVIWAATRPLGAPSSGPEAPSGAVQTAPLDLTAWPACANDGWAPPATDRTVTVSNTEDLVNAARSVKPRTTILVADGTYRLTQFVDLTVPGTVLRSRSGDPDKVIIRGGGMDDTGVGIALSVSATDVTIADVTAGYVGYHAVQVRGERGASRVAIHRVRLIDAGQQLLKGSVSTERVYADDGLVACSRFEFSTTAPSDYTDGIDLLAAKGWVIRDNLFLRIRGPQAIGWKAGPAILLWANSQDTLIERNMIVDSFRGIALGLGPGITELARDGDRSMDHQRGVVRNNVVCNANPWADEAIEANGAVDYRIEHNTVFKTGVATPWAIGIRFPMTRGIVRNNLTNAPILRRDGGRADVSNTIENADPTWFANARGCDLHLTSAARGAIDAGAAIPEMPLDFDRRPRAGAPDLGAYEFRAGAPERPR